MRLLKLLGLFYNFYEYEMLGLRRIEPARFIGAWLPRWREPLLYGRIAIDLGLGRGFAFQRYLPRWRRRSVRRLGETQFAAHEDDAKPHSVR